MKLFVLRRKESTWEYDETRGFVIRSRDEDSAREFIAVRTGDERWLVDPGFATCEELTKSGIEEVILEDYLAG